MNVKKHLEQNEKLVCEVQGSHAGRLKSYAAGLAMVAVCVWILVKYPDKVPVFESDVVNPVFLFVNIIIALGAFYLLLIYAGIARNRWWISDRRLFYRSGITGAVKDIKLYQVTHIATVANRQGRRGQILLQYRGFGDQYLGLAQVRNFRDVARLLRFYRNRARDFGENQDFEVSPG